MAAPLDVAVRANGNYLVVAGADTSSFVRELTPEGEIVREWVPAAPGEN